MDRGQADIILAELGKQLGVASLAFNDSGTCSFAVDDGAVIVTLGYNERVGAIDVMSCLDEIAPSTAAFSRALKANFGWAAADGASFAVEPSSGALVLQRRCLAAELGHGRLQAILESFVAHAQAWTKLLASESARRTPVAKEKTDRLPHLNLGLRA